MSQLYDKARAECIRALDIVDKTQITLFQQRDSLSRESLIDRIDALEENSDDDVLAGMRGLLNDVVSVYNDPFAGYINPSGHKRYTERRSGDYVGIGIKYRVQKDAYPLVIGALSGGPLDSANILPGDRLTQVIDGDKPHDLLGLSSKEVSAKLSGDAESFIDLQLERGEADRQIRITVQRRAVELHYARSTVMNGDTAYIKISRFGSDTHEYVSRLLGDLLEQSIASFILDLRDNPGGSTRAARAIMSMFHEAQWVYCEQYKNGRVRKLPRHGNKITDLPVVVLVNEYSMSSSEILAGALQDYQRARIVGAPTYGKGLIQKVFPLKEPLGGAIRTTIAQYATPSHRLLHGRGLTPDLYVPSAPERLFREIGSLNISDQARAFQRTLLEESLRKRKPPEEANRLIALRDAQLAEATNTLNRM